MTKLTASHASFTRGTRHFAEYNGSCLAQEVRDGGPLTEFRARHADRFVHYDPGKTHPRS